MEKEQLLNLAEDAIRGQYLNALLEQDKSMFEVELNVLITQTMIGLWE